MTSGENDGIRQDLDELLVHVAHVARTKDGDVFLPVSDGDELLQIVYVCFCTRFWLHMLLVIGAAFDERLCLCRQLWSSRLASPRCVSSSSFPPNGVVCPDYAYVHSQCTRQRGAHGPCTHLERTPGGACAQE